MKLLLKLAIIAALWQSVAFATTWYIRADGAGRFDSNRVTLGKTGADIGCDGQGDQSYAAAGGTGTQTNLHCAFNDLRFMWDDQTFPGTQQWVMVGGDVLVIRGCVAGPNNLTGTCRIGSDLQGGSGWCPGVGNAGCYQPPIPAGTTGAHTRILGANYAACGTATTTDKTKLQETFGGWGLGVVWNLTNTSFVDIQCLNVTRHSQCIFFGSPQFPAACNRNFPDEDDYADNGITTNANTHDVFLTDIWSHGFLSRGVIGPIGGLVQCLRCNIDSNGGAGWDFDDGSSTPMGAGAKWVFNYSIIQWNGCNQEYPFVHAIPVISCYSQGTGGYGDGVGSPAGTGFSVSLDHSTFVYNTQDGIDLGHVDTGGPFSLLATNIFLAHNNGSNGIKWDNKYGSVSDPVIVTGNVILNDCSRMSAPIDGAPLTYNTNNSDFCRAGDAWPFNFDLNTLDIVANNTIISYASTMFDWSCNAAGPSPCPLAKLSLYNNVVIGVVNLGAQCSVSGFPDCAPGFANNPGSNYGGTNAGPGLINLQNGGPGVFDFQSNYCFGIRSNCPSTGFVNRSPLLAGMPTFVKEGDLDVFGTTAPIQSAWQLVSGVPAGISYAQMPTIDIFGNSAPSSMVIGAVFPSGTPPPPTSKGLLFNGVKMFGVKVSH